MKRFLALTVIVFIALIAVSQWTTTKGDTDGSKTGTAANVAASANFKITEPLKVPISQVGLNQIANESGHLVVSINMTWLLLTGFLVLFMQVGFAFLVTGLTRAKNAGHMMMMNIASFAIALIAYYVVGLRVPVRRDRHRRCRQPRRPRRAHGRARSRPRRPHRPARLLPADRGRLRRRRDGVLPLPGRVHGDGRLHHHRRDRGTHQLRRLHPRRDRDGRDRSTRSTATGCGVAAGCRSSATRSTSATARSTSPGPVSSMRPAAGRPSRWP